MDKSSVIGLVGKMKQVMVSIIILQTIVQAENLSISPVSTHHLSSLPPFPPPPPDMPTSPYPDAILSSREIIKQVCVEECNKKLGLNFNFEDPIHEQDPIHEHWMNACIEDCKKNPFLFIIHRNVV